MTLRATIEVVPFGIESEKRTIAVVEASNTGCRYSGECTYKGMVDNRHRDVPVWHLHGIKHVREDGALELIRKVIEQYLNKGLGR